MFVADGALSTNNARILRLYRPRIDVASGMYYGASTAVQIELWSFPTKRSSSPSRTR